MRCTSVEKSCCGEAESHHTGNEEKFNLDPGVVPKAIPLTIITWKANCGQRGGFRGWRAVYTPLRSSVVEPHILGTLFTANAQRSEYSGSRSRIQRPDPLQILRKEWSVPAARTKGIGFPIYLIISARRIGNASITK